MRTNQDIVNISNALRATPHPRAWFDDPTGACGSFMDWHIWDHQVAYPTSSQPPYRGRRSATSTTDKRLGLTYYLDTIAGANLVWEASRDWSIFPVRDSVGGPGGVPWQYPWFWSMRMNRSNPVGSNTGEKYQGICWGDYWDINTPWQTGFGGSIATGRVGLHYNFTLEKWQVMVYLADGNAPDLFDCNPSPPFTVDQEIAEVSLLWVPPLILDGSPRNARLVGMINGETVFDLLDYQRCNEMTGNPVGPGIYWTNGSNASSACSEGGFFVGRYWIPLPI